MNPLPSASSESPASPAPTRRRINWVIFWMALLAPPLLTSLLVLAKASGAAPVVALVGSGLSGAICGSILGRRFENFALGIVFAVIFAVASIGMSCFGCLASGFEMKFR